MKKSLLIHAVLLFACHPQQAEYKKAENALDAGREFIGSRLQGDYLKAAFYMLPNAGNTAVLNEMEKAYREKDRDGRQQLRTASINIKEVRELNDSITYIYFQNSFDQLADTIKVIRQKDNWLVDLANKN